MIDERKKHLIERCDEHKDIAPLDDGYQRYWVTNRGALSALDMRTIADELDRRNLEWENDLKSFLAQKAADEESETTR